MKPTLRLFAAVTRTSVALALPSTGLATRCSHATDPALYGPRLADAPGTEIN